MLNDMAGESNIYEDPENPGFMLPKETSDGGPFTGEYLNEARTYYRRTAKEILESFALYSPLGNYGPVEKWDKMPFSRMVGYLQNPKVVNKHEVMERVLHYADWDVMVDYVIAKLPTPPALFEYLMFEYQDSLELEGEDSLLYKTGMALAQHPDLSQKHGLILAQSPQDEVLLKITQNRNLLEETRTLAALNRGDHHIRHSLKRDDSLNG